MSFRQPTVPLAPNVARAQFSPPQIESHVIVLAGLHSSLQTCLFGDHLLGVLEWRTLFNLCPANISGESLANQCAVWDYNPILRITCRHLARWNMVVGKPLARP